MKKALLLVLLFAMCLACDSHKVPVADKAAESKQIMQVLEDFHSAYESSNFYKLEETLADDVTFFGTDSSETIKSRAELKEALEKGWKNFKIKYGKLIDVTIDMDLYGTLAAVIYGVTTEIIVGNESVTVFSRYGKTLVKEEGKWRIARGVVGIVSTRDDYIAFMKKLSSPPTDSAQSKQK